MLHIILLILKIIGILILAILGLIIFVLLLVLFTPLRYELKGQGSKDIDSLELYGRFSIFIRLINVHVQFKDRQLSWKANILWKKLNSDNEKSSLEDSENNSEYQLEEFSIDEALPAKKPDSQPKADPKSVPLPEKPVVPEKQDKEEPASNKNSDLVSARKPEAKQKVQQRSQSAEQEKKQDSKERQTDKKSLADKIDSLFDKIKCTFKKIYDKIEQAEQIKEKAVDFLENEQHKAAFFKLLAELKKLLRKLKPKKLNANIEFGFEDPAVTGKILGGISLFYCQLKDHVSISANFEEKVLAGDLYLKGKIRISMFLSFALNMIINKNVRITIADILKLVKKGGKKNVRKK